MILKRLRRWISKEDIERIETVCQTLRYQIETADIKIAGLREDAIILYARVDQLEVGNKE